MIQSEKLTEARIITPIAWKVIRKREQVENDLKCRALTLSFCEEEFNVDKCLKLQASVSKMVALKELNLTIKQFVKFENADLEKVGVCLSKLISLEKLTLNFDVCRSLTDAGLIKFSPYLSEMANLKTLSLSLKQCLSLTDKSLNKLSQNISKLLSLEKVSLDFFECNRLTAKSVNKLFDALKRFNLRKFDLNWGLCRFFDTNCLKSLGRLLSNFKSLESLSLNFFGLTRIEVEGVIALKQSLANSQKLSCLALDFSNCSTVTDDFNMALFELLFQLEGLEDLQLKFWSCNQVSDITLSKLGKAVENLKVLQKFVVQLQSIKITDSGIHKLVTSLQGLPLKKVDFNFNRSCITEAGARNLGQSLLLLIDLKAISLRLSQCDGMTDEAVSVLTEKLAGKPEIEFLYLDFWGLQENH